MSAQFVPPPTLEFQGSHPRPGRLSPWLRRSLLLSLGGLLLLSLSHHYMLVLVVGQSMRPTLENGTLLVVDQRAYSTADPGRGDIVVVRRGHEYLVKRVVGLPGEEVELQHGTLFINGSPFTENHPTVHGPLGIGKGSLAPGRFAVLGDNRGMLAGQSVHGVFGREQIVGKVITAGLHLVSD